MTRQGGRRAPWGQFEQLRIVGLIARIVICRRETERSALGELCRCGRFKPLREDRIAIDQLQRRPKVDVDQLVIPGAEKIGLQTQTEGRPFGADLCGVGAFRLERRIPDEGVAERIKARGFEAVSP